MKSNPFLKSEPNKRNNDSNNRFKFLDDDIDITYTKEKQQQKNTNTNLEPSSRNVSFHRDFRSKRRAPPPPEAKKPEFNLANELFPDLGMIRNDIIDEPIQKNNYRDIVTAVEVLNPDTEDAVKPGWVEITSKNGIHTYRYGASTLYEQKKKEKEQRENSPHFIMNKAVTLMTERWENYKSEYNAIHGENAYEDKFVLPLVYEYETDNDSDYYSDTDDQEN